VYEPEKTKPFRLSERFLEKYKNTKPPFGFNGLGEFIYRRTYSRIKPSDGTNEEWWETIQRVVEGTYNMQKRHVEFYTLKWNAHQAQYSAQEMYDRMFHMKFLPSGRGLWAMGSPIIEERGMHMALSSCAMISTANIKDDPAKPFCFLMDVSMLGVGSGFSTDGAGKITIKGPSDTRKPEVFIIPDTREGWVESVKLLLESYFFGTGKIEFDYTKIRQIGEPIRGFGGVSSGYKPLEKLHQTLRQILDKEIDNPISVTTIVDIMNLIGQCVVSGNVRRCLPQGTLVHTKKGLLKIEDLKAGMMAKTSTGYDKITEVVYQGKQNTITIQTIIGDLKCTPKHRVAKLTSPTEYTWVYAKDLKENDLLVFVASETDGIKTKLPDWTYEKPKHSTTCKDITIPDLDHDMAWFFGLLHGDGYVAPNFDKNGFNAHISVACAPDNNEIVLRCREQIKRFGVNINIVPPKIGDRSTKIRSQSKQLAWYLSQFKMPREPIVIPDFIMNGKTDLRAAYLAGLLDADGCVKSSPIILVTTIYEHFLYQVQSLYASLGIPTRIRYFKSMNGWKPKYALHLVGKYPKARFMEIVAPHSSKQTQINYTRGSQNDYGYPMSWANNKMRRTAGYYAKQITQFTYQRLSGNFTNITPIRVNNVVFTNKKSETWDISVESQHEFVIDRGLLVHNTALITFGDPESQEYVDLKNPKVNPERCGDNGWAWTSNNSVCARLGMDYSKVSKRTVANGEPGYIWLDNARGYSRMNNGPDNKDHRVVGTNPCSEQFLESYELCCLVEAFPCNNESKEDFLRTLKYAYLYAKTVTLGQTHWPETNGVMLRNRRIGTSLSGIQQFIAKHNIDILKEWCEDGYNEIKRWDRVYSDWLGIPRSIKISTVKPSGSISLLAGATAGIHFPEGRYFVKRVRIAKNSPLIAPLRKAGYPIEDDVNNEYAFVVEFPVDVGKNVRSVKNVSAWEKTSMAAFMQHYWSDNAVSTTVDFDPETEGDQIERILDMYQYQLKAISFLPRMAEGAYPQMPQEAITEEEYKQRSKKLKPVKYNKIITKVEAEHGCTTDYCEIKDFEKNKNNEQ